MKRWHQFNDGHSPRFGFGTTDQVARYLATINGQRAVNHYVATALARGEEPIAEGLVVDLDSGLTQPTRYKPRQPPHPA